MDGAPRIPRGTDANGGCGARNAHGDGVTVARTHATRKVGSGWGKRPGDGIIPTGVLLESASQMWGDADVGRTLRVRTEQAKEAKVLAFFLHSASISTSASLRSAPNLSCSRYSNMINLN